MKLTIVFAIVLLTATLGYSQTACPEGMVCITPEAARAALEAGDKVKALEKQVAALEQIIKNAEASEKAALVESSFCRGENTALKQQQIRDMALVDLALKQTKKKRNGFINIF